MGSRLVLLPLRKALLSISDGRASSFFNTFLKIITPPPFLRAADFRVQRYEEKTGKSEKIREIRRNSEKIGEKSGNSEKNREIRRKIREKPRKIEIICKFLCISVRFICKSLLISVRIVSSFCSKSPTPQGFFTFLPFYSFTFLPFYSFTFLPFYLFTFKCPMFHAAFLYLCL